MPSHGHEDLGTTLWAVNSVFVGLATVAIIGRFYARKLRKLSPGFDDWAIFTALVLNWILYGLFIGCRQHGLGKHRDVISETEVVRMKEHMYFFLIFYVLAPPTVKICLLLLYKRVFVSSRFLLLVNITGVVISIWVIIMMFLGIFLCSPISAFWTEQGTCIPLERFTIGYGVVNIVTDMAVWLMPIPVMWRLQLPMAQKIALTLTFALGLLYVAVPYPVDLTKTHLNLILAKWQSRSSDVVVATVRMLSLLTVFGTWDITYAYSHGFMWSIVEVSVGIICTCLPTMFVILKSTFNGKLGRMLGFSSLPSHRHSAARRSWIRPREYDEILGTWMIHDGRHQHNSDVTTGNVMDTGCERAGTSGIRVLEEVKVELQSIEPAVYTTRDR